MSKLDNMGALHDFDEGIWWGTKRRYPTKEAFVDALIEDEVIEEEDKASVHIGECWMRYTLDPYVCEEPEGCYEEIDHPGRGCTPVWRFSR